MTARGAYGGTSSIDWPSIDGLGVESDRIIAERLGVSAGTVINARRRLGIEAAHPGARAKGIAWDDVPDLGRVPDRVIAERFGVAVMTVTSARSVRGIPAWQACTRVDWSVVPDLFEAGASALACRLGVSRQAVYAARLREAERARLSDLGFEVV